MRKQFDKQEAIIKTQIDKAYIEYQQFMKTSNMPKYKFIYSNQKGTTIAEARYENNMYNLIIADTMYTTYKAGAKGTLFHEFTHIYDEEQLTNVYGFSHNDRNTPYVYKELHAEQVKSLFLLGCKTLDDIENVNPENKKFLYKQNLYTIYEYLLEYKTELINNIAMIEAAKKTNTKIDMYEFNIILNRIFYYIGTASVYLKYCNDSVYNELDIQCVYDYYGFGLEFLIKVLLENSIGYHTEELIKAMGSVRKNIVLHFGDDLKLIHF
jgi:hypothetical protein